MREKFRAYYSPTAEEFERLWDEAVIVFDANALLNLFRYSAPIRDEWLDFLDGEKGRLWLPHQAALEFHRIRRLIAGEQEKAFADVEDALRNAEQTIRKSIDGLRRHPTREAEELSDLIERHMRKVRKKFKKARARHFQAVVYQEAHDKTLEAITTLYDGNVGEAYADDDLKALYKEGSERFAKKIPPGYMDADKKGDEKYGDLVLWRQILDYGAEVKKPLIFVTDDSKEDWWFKSGGKTFGPRPELVAEYFEVAGQRAHFYQPRAFLKFAIERGEQISAAALAEAKSVSAARVRVGHDYVQRLLDGAVGSQGALEAIARASSLTDYAKLSSLNLPGISEAAQRIAQLGSTSALAAMQGPDLSSIRESLYGLGSSSSLSAALAAQEAIRRSIYDVGLSGVSREALSAYLTSYEADNDDSDDDFEDGPEGEAGDGIDEPGGS